MEDGEGKAAGQKLKNLILSHVAKQAGVG